MTTAIIITVVAIVGLAVLRAYTIGDAAARHIARIEYGRLRKERPEDVLAGLSEQQFVELYERLRYRRFWTYLVLFLAVSVVGVIMLLALMSVVLRLFDPGLYVSGFTTFFGLIAVCVACLAWTMRLYTRNLHGAMRKALKV
jgi:hypothetical protein